MLLKTHHVCNLKSCIGTVGKHDFSWKLLQKKYSKMTFSRISSLYPSITQKFILCRHKLFSKPNSCCFSSNVLNIQEETLSKKSRKTFNSHCIVSQRRHNSTLKYITSLDCPPVKFAYDTLLSFHDSTGLPWWATVVLTSIMLRTVVTLPLFIVSQSTIARYKNVQSELKDISDRLRVEVFHFTRENNMSHFQSSRLFKHEMKKHYNKKMIEENCHPFRAFLVGFVQVPVWVFMTFGLRNLCGFSYANKGENIHEGMSSEGLLWFTDLTVADPTFILPVLLGLSNLFITEIHYLSSLSSGIQDTRRARFIRNFMRCVSLGMIPLGAMVPSVMCLYWATSSVYGLAQNLIIQQPIVRRLVGIPWTEGESEQPYRDMIKMAKTKYLKQS